LRLIPGKSMTTLIADYHYPLPPELVAQYPLAPRDASRLLVLQRDAGSIHPGAFRDLPQWLDENDLLVLNDTRVFPARLRGHKLSGGRVELLLHHLPVGQDRRGAACRAPYTAKAEATYRGRLKKGQVLKFGPSLEAEVINLPQPGVAEVRFFSLNGDLSRSIQEAGEVPLPPYIHRDAEEEDQKRYQTVYAARPGAIACPTAGLHFTEEMLAALKARGIDAVTVTLHVGPGTFKPVKHRDYTRHRMEPEYFELSEEAAARLTAARGQGKRLTAVGSTSVRVLEHCAGPGGFIPQKGWCGLYIYPGYRFRAVDRMLTNFHLPRSTLLLLVSAFTGRDLIMRAYEAAIQEKYRFYSYGDAMLII
jgi:S-adenosylmethionine:tRNA ribosyltransferase-isomerase